MIRLLEVRHRPSEFWRSVVSAISPRRSAGVARCSICELPVSLETAKTDEYGRAIHEECYASKMGFECSRKPRLRLMAWRKRGSDSAGRDRSHASRRR